ncbi:Exodeoxyribonuclease III [Hartmannibacter diazotrophicus]|uniref:Exodeoxyribonuclease III n=1 Tax=Hartmannibacter diazotrophicus TaxID=1482074 RepID=A0A2C9DC77_9HYPH|nr:exodeoxyribonuclease III [Hartmannibacter diazotrophicus]SON57843.1 Exodeoxyribonuclease III [Hartmannibacter diazotrophicus]
MSSALLSIATWNINSVRMRRGIVEQLIDHHAPDVICLQETKCADAQFPSADFRRFGYSHIALNGGRGGYHGVAILSRFPLLDVDCHDFCAKNDPRHVAVTVERGDKAVRLHNFYVPAGGDEPDPAINPKFEHKLQFLQEMTSWLPTASNGLPDVIVGDLNIAPYESDVWSHKALLKVVSHTPVECEALEALRLAGGWTDLARSFHPEPERVYTWWSYRAKDWRAANKGRRLDHIWTHPDLAAKARSISVLVDARGWSRPSDHVPIIAHFDLG